MSHDLSDKKVDERILRQLLEVVRRYQGDPPKNGSATQAHLDGLTSRENEILSFLAKGSGTSEISKQLSISPNTVRNHIQHILQKLQVHTRLEAVT